VGFVVLLALIGGALAAGFSYYNWCGGASGEQVPLTVEIPEGTSGSEVVSILSSSGVIRCDLVSKFVVRRRGLQASFIAGTYDLTTNMELDSVLDILTTPPRPVETVRLTIPEGYRVSQTAERVEEDLGIPANRFVQAAQSGEFALPPYLPEGTETVEGFLFPKSYEFVKESRITSRRVIEELLEQFAQEVGSLPWRNARALALDRYEIIIIASMIEEEAQVPEERAMISAVIHNRLAIGEVLGIDATLLYDDPTPEDGTLTESDLAFDSPYNTRLRAGLPPTPISSPGLASIEAALEPADVDFLYYVLCPEEGEGVHRFTRTLEDHVNATNECLG
jgi:UPF0755 protein